MKPNGGAILTIALSTVCVLLILHAVTKLIRAQTDLHTIRVWGNVSGEHPSLPFVHDLDLDSFKFKNE